ncbi:hypothetical protein ABGB12_34875 [Actinocorallia sp. B10E7]|uniref:hypothetical protein n=1 Tax=Actinocorallia sp. B10E7 TaxID=3153558 RepID=UPI00325CAF7D
MSVLAFPTRPNTPARPDSRRLFAALLIAVPEAVSWALEQMTPELLHDEPLPADYLEEGRAGYESDPEWDARADAAWEICGELLHEWIDAHGLTLPAGPAHVLDGAA